MNDAIQALTLEKIESVFDRYFGFRLKRAQVDALHHLLCDRMDLILIAKTGFGKSILFQAAPLMFSPCKSVLIIMPLIALEEEQCEKFTLIDNCRPIVLNGDNNNLSTLTAIRHSRYTHDKSNKSVCIQVSALIVTYSIHESRNSNVEIV